MKVYVSADIEGVTGTNNWNETELGQGEYVPFAKQMTLETKAACEGILEVGGKEIVVKDAHDSGRNIDINLLPKNAKLIRGWTSDPYSMIGGIDESFDAAVFIGYHSGAGQDGSPLAHTMNTNTNYIKINGMYATEYLIHAYAAAELGIPVVFLSGDKMLCENVKKFNPEIEVTAVKEGIGNATKSINPQLSCELIKDGVIKGLKKLNKCKIQIPEKFEVEINYKQHYLARKASYYPGVTQIAPYTIKYTAESPFELMTTRMFIL